MPETTEAPAPTDAPSHDAQPVAINVRSLSHTYPKADQPALDGVTFSVQPGEIFGILGPNGGGKTTLFRILSTLMPLANAGGESGAAIAGEDVANAPGAVRQQLGVVFQSPSLDAKLTAEENLQYQAGLYGLTAKDAQPTIDHYLSVFNLADRRGDTVQTFSGGMQRRVEIAKAMLHQPQVLLLDEPSTGLDPGARRDVWQQLDHLRREEGVTVVMTTHLMEEADKCDRLAILDHGKLIALGTPDELKQKIGGEIVTVEPLLSGDGPSAEDIAAHLRVAYPDADEPTVTDDTVRFEHADGASVVSQLSAHFAGSLRRIAVGRPSLEDVFLHLTGYQFDKA